MKMFSEWVPMQTKVCRKFLDHFGKLKFGKENFLVNGKYFKIVDESYMYIWQEVP